MCVCKPIYSTPLTRNDKIIIEKVNKYHLRAAAILTTWTTKCTYNKYSETGNKWSNCKYDSHIRCTSIWRFKVAVWKKSQNLTACIYCIYTAKKNSLQIFCSIMMSAYKHRLSNDDCLEDKGNIIQTVLHCNMHNDKHMDQSFVADCWFKFRPCWRLSINSNNLL